MITATMRILDIVEKYPETENVFHEYDDVIGHCVLCYDLFDTIEKIATEYNLDVDDILEKLNEVIS